MKVRFDLTPLLVRILLTDIALRLGFLLFIGVILIVIEHVLIFLYSFDLP